MGTLFGQITFPQGLNNCLNYKIMYWKLYLFTAHSTVSSALYWWDVPKSLFPIFLPTPVPKLFLYGHTHKLKGSHLIFRPTADYTGNVRVKCLTRILSSMRPASAWTRLPRTGQSNFRVKHRIHKWRTHGKNWYESMETVRFGINNFLYTREMVEIERVLNIRIYSFFLLATQKQQ